MSRSPKELHGEIMYRNEVFQTGLMAGLLDGIYDGEMTVGEALIRFHAFDLIVHRWDLARSQGVDARFTDAEIDCVEESLALFGDAAYTPGILGEPVPVADDADRQTRLLGRLGRRG